MTLDYYDKDGVPISINEWGSKFEDQQYKRVARTTITDAADPTKMYDISTVWLGLNHNYSEDGPPLIFETMVFGDDSSDLDMYRYATQQEAKDGHITKVIEWSAKLIDPIVMEAE